MNRFRVLLPACLLGVAVVLSLSADHRAGAQQLLGPSYTPAQRDAGAATYKQSCANCHGTNLDNGTLGPPLRGADFRAAWFGQSAESLISKLETMPPAAPGSLGTPRLAELLAWLMAQNQIDPGTQPVPSDRAALSALLLPSFVAGPSGGLAGGVPVPAGPGRVNPLDRYTPVTDAMLQAPPEGEWLTWRRGFDGQGFSPLRQITRENVSTLRVAWTWSLPAGPNGVTPLVHDGVLFVHAFGDRVQALDAATGDLLWQYTRRLPMGIAPTVKRSIALYGDKVYLGTSDTHVVALDARTGRVAWETPVAQYVQGYGMTGGVTVARGKVIASTTGFAGGGNFIVALDAETGFEAWRFNTIPREDQPGGNTWNGVPYRDRIGGSVWVPGSFDPATGLVYFGVAQTYDTERYRVRAAGQNNDLLYTDSTVALDVDTGRLVWHFQHLPNDQWDYDWAFGRILMQLTPGAPTLVGTGGKQAIFDFVDAASGRYAFSFDLGLQNVITAIDPVTGAKRIDPQFVPGGNRIITACPHAGGAKNWLPDSYNPGTRVLFVPLVESCMDIIPAAPGTRTLSSGVRWTLRARPDSDGRYGRVQAIDVATRQTVWTMRQRAPQTTGVLATAGGVVFAGALDRVFAAYDDADGRELWRVRLTDVPASAPISYSVGGRQYVAMTVGNGGAQAFTFPALVPEIRNPPDRSAAVWVFELAGPPAP